MNKIVITGAMGFIGSHVYDRFRKEYPEAEIIIVDKMCYAARATYVPDVAKNDLTTLLVADLADKVTIMEACKMADLVVHVAAENHVDDSFEKPYLFVESNVIGTLAVLEACRHNAVPKMVHISTDEVYGETAKKPFREGARFRPTNPYAATKAAAEMMVMSYVKSYKMDISTVRANNIYGIRQYPDNVIPKFILMALNNHDFTLHGGGHTTRHFLSAKDAANAILLVAQIGAPGASYNIASELEISIKDLAAVIRSAAGSSSTMVTVEDRPYNDSSYHVDDRAIRFLGWSPKHDLIMDLPFMIAWYSKNESLFKQGY